MGGEGENAIYKSILSKVTSGYSPRHEKQYIQPFQWTKPIPKHNRKPNYFHIKRTRCTIITNNLTVSKDSISVAWCVHDCGNIIHTTDDPSQASATLNSLSTQTLLDKYFTTVPLYLKSNVNMVKLITQRQSKLCFLLHGWITNHKRKVGNCPVIPDLQVPQGPIFNICHEVFKLSLGTSIHDRLSFKGSWGHPS